MSDNDDAKLALIFIFVAALCFEIIVWTLVGANIYIQDHRRETLTQQLYNRCLGQTDDEKSGSACAYVLKGGIK